MCKPNEMPDYLEALCERLKAQADAVEHENEELRRKIEQPKEERKPRLKVRSA